MDERARDQLPEAWSAGAAGYAEAFARFTGLYVDEVLDLLGVGDGTELLDVAAGTGAVALRAAGRGARVVATDFAPGMVEVLTEGLRRGGHTTSRAEVMDGQDLDLPGDSADAGVSMFGLMFFPDPAAGLAELRRVVRPGGRVAIGTWHLDEFPVMSTVGAGLGAMVEGLERPAPTWAPLGYPDALGAAVGNAGFVDVAVHRIVRRWRYDDPRGFFRSLPDWSPPVQQLFDVVPRELIDTGAAAFAAAVAEFGDGVPTEALVAVGTVPAS